MASRAEFLTKIKEIQKEYTELNQHQMDEYRCRYYGDVIDLYHVYTHVLERELRRLKSNTHAITNVKGLKEMLDRPKGTITDKDWHRAVRLTMSVPERKHYFDGMGHKKDFQMKKDKSAKRAEKNGIRTQYSDEQLEVQLKAEDNWIMDVFDNYYDEEDMHR